MEVKDLNTIYRPVDWDSVKGQDLVVKLLKGQVETKNGLSNGYIFAGPSGVGKTTLARLFFKCLNDTDDWRTDLLEINASNTRGIDDMRELIKQVEFMPFGKYKGILLDECHMLSKPAWNCLLKPLEEASQRVFWFLCTTELGKVPKTIQTRCQMLKLGPLSWTHIHNRLVEIVDETKIPVSDKDLWVISRNSNNNLRQAIHILEQYGVTKDLDSIIKEDINIDFLKAISSNNLPVIWKVFTSWQTNYPDIDTFLNSLKYDLSTVLKIKMGIPAPISPTKAKIYREVADAINEQTAMTLVTSILEMQEKISGVWDYNSLFLKVLCEMKKS